MPLAFDWTQLVQQTVIGLASGGVWASLAVALVLIYRSTGVVNFAQGEMAMFSTFIAWSLVHQGLSYWAAFFLTLAVSFVGGVAVERRRGRRVLDPGPRHDRRLARCRRPALALLPFHEARPRVEGVGVEPGGEPARRRPRQLDARA